MVSVVTDSESATESAEFSASPSESESASQYLLIRWRCLSDIA